MESHKGSGTTIAYLFNPEEGKGILSDNIAQTEEVLPPDVAINRILVGYGIGVQ